MLAVGMGGGIMVIWLVLTPKLPTGAADEELRAPFPAQIGRALDQHGAEPTAIITKEPSVPAPRAEQQPLVRSETDTIRVIVEERLEAIPPMMAQVVIQTDQGERQQRRARGDRAEPGHRMQLQHQNGEHDTQRAVDEQGGGARRAEHRVGEQRGRHERVRASHSDRQQRRARGDRAEPGHRRQLQHQNEEHDTQRAVDERVGFENAATVPDQRFRLPSRTRE
jgi:hypothetical protein